MTQSAVDCFLEALTEAKRPLILAGHGIRASHCVERFLEFIETIDVPVVTTQFGKDIIPYAHPLFIGHPGVKGDRAGGLAVQNADSILIIGCSLHAMTTGYELDKFAPKAKKIQIDLDDAILRKTPHMHGKFQLSIQDFLEGIRNRIITRTMNSEWLEQLHHWKNELSVDREPHQRTEGELNYYDVVACINELSSENDIIIADAGSAYYIVGQAWKVKKGQRVIMPGSLAQMGYATSAAIGAAMADADRRVIVITGDGSFQTNVHDLAVMAEYPFVDIKIFVIENGGYLSIRNTQRNYFESRFAGIDDRTGVFLPDLLSLCDAYGMRYFTAEEPDSMHNTVRKALEYRYKCLTEIRTIRNQQIIPCIQSTKLPDGTMKSGTLDEMYPYS